MSFQNFSSTPYNPDRSSDGGARSQFGALCYREKDGKPEILLITSRGTGRWIIPKGWPVKGEPPQGSAATEAYEEAGVEGVVHPNCVGLYSYLKILEGEPHQPCVVSVYAIKVKRLLRRYPEADQRKRRWFGRKKASSLVDEPELQQLIKHFDPRRAKH